MKKLFDKNGKEITAGSHILWNDRVRYLVVINNENPNKEDRLTGVTFGSSIETDIERYMPSEYMEVVD